MKHKSALVARFRFELKTLFGQRPGVTLPVVRYLRRRRRDADRLTPQPIESNTEIVIEGYPRSPSTFATIAFFIAQNRSTVHIGHHVRSPAQIIEARRRSIPAILLIREPTAAVVSLIIRNALKSPTQALRAYRRFYETPIDLRDDVVVADFNQDVADFGIVIDAVNDRFGSSFRRFDHTEANLNRCFQILTERYQRRSHDGKVATHAISLPTEQRAARQQELKQLIVQPMYATALDISNEIYCHLTGAPHRGG